MDTGSKPQDVIEQFRDAKRVQPPLEMGEVQERNNGGPATRILPFRRRPTNDLRQTIAAVLRRFAVLREQQAAHGIPVDLQAQAYVVHKKDIIADPHLQASVDGDDVRGRRSQLIEASPHLGVVHGVEFDAPHGLVERQQEVAAMDAQRRSLGFRAVGGGWSRRLAH